ncbi:hypothetical protein FH972_010596 [Carpinus fangiana]|uniref:Uncharacterized protein n=1 Tax=Carpinus fangiana TaxID=176857 RepID=A0A660KQT7_9ROSI|nr:hypothetical protein FH972_010596 [Carpinus fangiana]
MKKGCWTTTRCRLLTPMHEPSSESRGNIGTDLDSGSCARALLRAASADPVSSSHDDLMSADPFSAPTPTHTQ